MLGCLQQTMTCIVVIARSFMKRGTLADVEFLQRTVERNQTHMATQSSADCFKLHS